MSDKTKKDLSSKLFYVINKKGHAVLYRQADGQKLESHEDVCELLCRQYPVYYAINGGDTYLYLDKQAIKELGIPDSKIACGEIHNIPYYITYINGFVLLNNNENCVVWNTCVLSREYAISLVRNDNKLRFLFSKLTVVKE